MKRKNRLLIGLLSAGITFGSLTAFVGTEHWQRGHGYWHGHYHHEHCEEVTPTQDSSEEAGG